MTQSTPAEPRRTAEPHLRSLSGNAPQSVAVMEWARYLAAAFGTEGAVSALRYYEQINWISESVRRTMVDYVRGLSLDELTADDDLTVELDDSIDTLADTPFEKHARSIEYIADITGDNIEHDLLSMRLPEGDAVPEAVPDPTVDDD